MQVRMVGAGIYEELAILCCFFLVGAFLAACYDVLRIFRGIIPHGSFLVNLEDLVYWIYVAVVVFVELYDKNDGRLRGYVFGGLLAGMILYACSFGRICTPHIIRFFQRVLGVLLKPARRMAAFLRIKQRKGQDFCGKVWTCQKKRLKKLWKMVKMSISKL